MVADHSIVLHRPGLDLLMRIELIGRGIISIENNSWGEAHVAAAFVKERLKQDLRRMAAAYLDGASLRQLAQHYGCSDLTIRAVLVEAGTPMRSGRKRTMAETLRGDRAMMAHFGDSIVR
jgi:hypothetical protein